MRQQIGLLICLLALTSALAQESTQAITVDSAASLRLISAAGSALPGTLQFSPDSRYIVASTTDQTYLYTVDDLSAAPKIFPFTRFTFDDDAFLVADGLRWNLDTGLSVGIAPSVTVLPADGEHAATVEIVKPGGETIRVETSITQPLRHSLVNDDYSVLAIATDGDYRLRTQPAIHLYHLPSGEQIAALPQSGNDPIDRIFFTESGATPMVVALGSNFYDEYDSGFAAMYEAESGALIAEFSGRTFGQPGTAADGKFGYALQSGVLVYGTGERIGSFEYEGQPVSVNVGDAGLALVAVDRLNTVVFAEEGLPVHNSELEVPPYYESSPVIIGDSLVYNVLDVFTIIGLQAPDATRRTVATEPDVSQVQIDPTLTRYSYVDPNGHRIVRNLERGDVLVEAAHPGALSPAWSHIAYWEAGRLIVVDAMSGQETMLEILPTYRGRVVDFVPGVVVFIGTTMQVVDLDPTHDADIGTIARETPPTEVLLFHSGLCLVTLDHVRDEAPLVTIYELNTEVGCEPARYRLNVVAGNTVVSPRGTYIGTYDPYCDAPYGSPETRIYPLRGFPEAEPSNVIWFFACGPNTYALRSDEKVAYIAASGYGLRRADLATQDVSYGHVEFMTPLLAYSDPPTGTSQFFDAVFLSPDDERIAVTVAEYNQSDYVTSYFIEVFALDDLHEGTQRRDVRPLLTVPDASYAKFSPDGRTIVTDTGLYSIEDADVTRAVDGTISTFSPDSQLLATYQDGFVTLWRVSQSGANNFPLAQYKISDVRELVFNADGTSLYVVRSGEVQVWGVTQ